MTQWYVERRTGQSDLGPLRPNELLELVRAGEVTSGTLVRKGDSKWFFAGEVGGLFEAARRPTIQYFCPQCEFEVSEPPVTCQKCGRAIRKAITKVTEHTIGNRADPPATGSSVHPVKRWLQKKGLGKSS